MKRFCFFIALLAGAQMFASASNSEFGNLSKKTIKGFVVPFVLRYEPEQWTMHSDNGLC